MKHAIRMMRMGIGAALALALGAAAGAQRAAARSLELSLDLIETEEIDAQAVIPLATDFVRVLRLSGGAPGSPALIEIGGLEATGAFSRCALFTGAFGHAGVFSVELPRALSVRDLRARGAAVPSRMVTVLVDLEDEEEVAYASWEVLSGIRRPLGGHAGGGRVRTPDRIPGHVGQAEVRDGMRSLDVDLEDSLEEGGLEWSFEELGRLPRPKGSVSSGGPRPPRTPGRAGEAEEPEGMVTLDAPDSEQAIEHHVEVLGRLSRPSGAISRGGHGQGGVIVCPAGLPEISWELLGSVEDPHRAGTPDAGHGRAARRGSP